VALAYDRPGIAGKQQTRRFRNPDLLANPVEEIRRLVEEFQKVSGARKLAQHISLSQSASPSFCRFLESLQQIARKLSSEQLS
jgi:hypothetical protein